MNTKPNFRKLLADYTREYAQATNAYDRVISLQKVRSTVEREQLSSQEFVKMCKEQFIPLKDQEIKDYDELFTELEKIIEEIDIQTKIELEDALNLEQIYLQTGRLSENQIIIIE